MNAYEQMSKAQLQETYNIIHEQYKSYQKLNLALDMSRGKPGADQLDLSMGLINGTDQSFKTQNGFDVRNYGLLDGIPEAKELFAEILEISPENILVGGNSSLNLMYDTVARAMSFGICGAAPWHKLEKVKFLCPVPGYDRHFAVCELFGIEMINVPMDNEGPDMEMVAELVEQDESVKGIWCVPKYTNPTGITYSDRVVRAFAALRPKAEDFRIFWDNAYAVHDLCENPVPLLDILSACRAEGHEDMVYLFASTSKISFSGAGVAAMAASKKNLNDIKKLLSMQTIGYDKINQLRHSRFFQDLSGVKAHMKRHKALILPKFQAVFEALERELDPLQIAGYTKPEGGYFVSVDTLPGCASRVCTLCKEAGVVLTPAGATYPYGKDPEDRNIRIAPTFPPVAELAAAMEVFTCCVKLAALEKMI